jgi:adenosylmethionine-8-amino-7-oxononanoate aminotransferase
MFACEHEACVPDLICLSKGITNGYLPLAATLCTEEIFDAFLGEFRELKTFFHGHSYTGNPLACAAASACIDVFQNDETLTRLSPKISLLGESLRSLMDMAYVGDVRTKGLMAGVELVKDRSTKEAYHWEEKVGWKVAYAAREQGVLLRPLGNVVVIMPPLSISIENLRRMMDVIRISIAQATA